MKWFDNNDVKLSNYDITKQQSNEFNWLKPSELKQT